MRAHKRNPYWGQGLDHRQARRLRRRNRVSQERKHQPGTPDCPALPAQGWCELPGHNDFDLARSCFDEFGPHTDHSDCARILDVMDGGYSVDPMDDIPWGTPDSWIPDNPNEDGFRMADFI